MNTVRGRNLRAVAGEADQRHRVRWNAAAMSLVIADRPPATELRRAVGQLERQRRAVTTIHFQCNPRCAAAMTVHMIENATCRRSGRLTPSLRPPRGSAMATTPIAFCGEEADPHDAIHHAVGAKLRWHRAEGATAQGFEPIPVPGDVQPNSCKTEHPSHVMDRHPDLARHSQELPFNDGVETRHSTRPVTVVVSQTPRIATSARN